MCTVSVIVPVYKAEPYLHRCVDSILGQTFTDFELILVDDGSPDNCPVICDEYAMKDGRVHVIHQKNGGLSAARNVGIDWAFANSDSQWLSFVDSDDWVHAEYLARLIDAAITNKVAVSICGFIRTEKTEPDVQLAETIAKEWSPESFYLNKKVNAVVAWGKLYRKQCFDEIRYPIGKRHEDEFTTYRILFALDHVAVIDQPLYFYFTNQEGIMHSPFSIKNYDGLLAREERIRFFTEQGYTSIVEMETNAQKYEIAFFAIAARKVGIYDQVPARFKMGWLRAMRTVRAFLNNDQYEFIMIKYYPRLVKLGAYCRKVLHMLPLLSKKSLREK